MLQKIPAQNQVGSRQCGAHQINDEEDFRNGRVFCRVVGSSLGEIDVARIIITTEIIHTPQVRARHPIKMGIIYLTPSAFLGMFGA